MPNFNINQRGGLPDHYDAGPLPQDQRAGAAQQGFREPSAFFKNALGTIHGMIENLMSKSMGQMAYAQKWFDNPGHAEQHGDGTGYHGVGPSGNAFTQLAQDLHATVRDSLASFTTNIEHSLQGLEERLTTMSMCHDRQIHALQGQIDELRHQRPGGETSTPAHGNMPAAEPSGRPGAGNASHRTPAFLRHHMPPRKPLNPVTLHQHHSALKQASDAGDAADLYRGNVQSDAVSATSNEDLYSDDRDDRDDNRTGPNHAPGHPQTSAQARPDANPDSDAAFRTHEQNALRDIERNAEQFAASAERGRDQASRITR